MTPKEKAIELFEKMCGYGDEYHHCTIYVSKQCALITVDEILSELAYTQNYVEDNMNKIDIYISYWQEVKQEIEKL